MGKRLEYIDALRGLAMLLVVFGHVTYFSFDMVTSVDIVVSSLHLPLFFFISGFVINKTLPSNKALLKQLWNKFTLLIIPALLVGLLFTYCVVGETATDFFNETMKFGYWFPISLYEMYLVYYVILWACDQVAKDNKCVFITILLIIALILWISRYCFSGSNIYGTLSSKINVWHTSNYFIFFSLGVAVSSYKHKVSNLLQGNAIPSVLLALYFIMMFLRFNDRFWLLAETKHLDGIISFIISILSVAVVYCYFFRNERQFTQETRVGRVFQLIGCRTMEIYLLHYFFLPDLTRFSSYLEPFPLVIGICIILFIEALVITASLFVGNVLRMSPLLSQYIIGVPKTK